MTNFQKKNENFRVRTKIFEFDFSNFLFFLNFEKRLKKFHNTFFRTICWQIFKKNSFHCLIYLQNNVNIKNVDIKKIQRKKWKFSCSHENFRIFCFFEFRKTIECEHSFWKINMIFVMKNLKKKKMKIFVLTRKILEFDFSKIFFFWISKNNWKQIFVRNVRIVFAIVTN